MDRPFSLYDVLNVPPGAPPAAIESSYRTLMKRHHPDQAGPTAGTRAAEINAAFSVLRDPERRSAYDRKEQARQRALIDRQVHNLRRRRRMAGWGGWGAAALLVCAATAFAADRYGGVLVRPATFVLGSESEKAVGARIDPNAIITEVIAESRKMSLAPQPAPAARPAPVAAEVAEPVAAAEPALRRRSDRPRPAEEPANDFLESRGIY
jgi:curved DNA-binding protein CbpA